MTSTTKEQAALSLTDEILVGIVGDLDPGRDTHAATEAAIAHAAAALRLQTATRWLSTPSLAEVETSSLEAFDGFFIAPGSPYRSMEGALRAIRFARERDVPLLATCGGFQHVVIEYARNVLGVANAGHAEYDHTAARAVITPLECSLAGQRHEVELEPGSRLREIYGAPVVEEEYRCRFGLNPSDRPALQDAGLRFVATDSAGAARAVELPQKRFFVATLYVPQLSSEAGRPHPLVRGFLMAAQARRG